MMCNESMRRTETEKESFLRIVIIGRTEYSYLSVQSNPFCRQPPSVRGQVLDQLDVLLSILHASAPDSALAAARCRVRSVICCLSATVSRLSGTDSEH